MHFWYQQGNKTLPGLYFQWGCWDTNQSDLVQALKHSVQVRKKLKCTILLHSCKMFRHLLEGIRCWRWTEDGYNKGGCEFSHFCWLKQEVNGGPNYQSAEQMLALCTLYKSRVTIQFFCSSPSQRAENIPRCPQNDPLCDLICSWPPCS